MYEFVRKVITKDGEREYFPSSLEEMVEFIVKRKREEFKYKDIICIKFEESSSENFDDVQSTSWFINPYYIKNTYSLIIQDTQQNFDFYEDVLEESIHETYMYPDSYGPKMSSDILPELLLTNAFWQDDSFLAKYDEFYNKNISKELSEQEFLDDFFEFLTIYPKY